MANMENNDDRNPVLSDMSCNGNASMYARVYTYACV